MERVMEMLQKVVQMPGLTCICVVLSFIVKQKGLTLQRSSFRIVATRTLKTFFAAIALL